MKLIGSINHYRADPSGWIGSIVMFLFSIIAIWKWQTTGFIFFALLTLRDLAATWFLLTRNPSLKKSKPSWKDILAYLSSAFPFFYLGADTPTNMYVMVNLITIAGFTLSTLALIELGQSFGVSPSNRGVVRSGVYRLTKHPMYLGYAISEIGFVLLNPINIFLWITSGTLYCFRAKLENKVLD